MGDNRNAKTVVAALYRRFSQHLQNCQIDRLSRACLELCAGRGGRRFVARGFRNSSTISVFHSLRGSSLFTRRVLEDPKKRIHRRLVGSWRRSFLFFFSFFRTFSSFPDLQRCNPHFTTQRSIAKSDPHLFCTVHQIAISEWKTGNGKTGKKPNLTGKDLY